MEVFIETDDSGDKFFSTLKDNHALHCSSRKVVFVSAVLITATCVAIPLTHKTLPFIPAFMYAFVSATGVLDLLTAVLLFELYIIEGLGIFFCAACAYLIDALLVWPYGFTFPELDGAAASFSNEQSAVWLWLVWHASFPTILIIGAFSNQRHRDDGKRGHEIMHAVVSIVIFSVLLCILVTFMHEALPIAVHNTTYTLLSKYIATLITCLNVVSVCVLMRISDAPFAIRAWLSVAVLASGLDVSLNAISANRFTVPWYVGKMEMLVTASVLLITLLRMWVALYANSVALTKALHVTHSERIRLQKRFEREHTIAAELQQASLPYSLPTFDDMILNAVYRPAVHDLEIGGDWYDAFVLQDGRLILTVGDVAGKGLSASLVMGKVRQMLRVAAFTNPDPATMLNITDRALRIEHAETIVTAFAAILNRTSRTLEWASAGHPPAFLRNKDGSITTLESLSLPLGLRENDPPSKEITISEGTMLVAYTDGLIELNFDIIDGCERVKKALLDPLIYDAANPAQVLHNVLIGPNARDDIAIVTLKVLSPIPQMFCRSWTGHSDNWLQVDTIRNLICEDLRTHGIHENQLLDVELIYSELTGNISRYAPGPFQAKLEIDNTTIKLTLTDQGPGFTFKSAEVIDPLSECGRGLFITATICSSFEIHKGEPGGSIAKATLLIH